MADVTVEFGAQDVGLEKTLKTIQDEISRLEGSVKSGNLPLDELQQKMREIGKLEATEKRIKAMGDSSAQASPQVREVGNDLKSTGDKSEKMGDQAGIGFGKLAAAVGVGQLAAKAFTAVLDAGFAAVRNTLEGFKEALDLGGKLSDLSAQTGESAGNLLLLQRAFDNTGLGADRVGPTLAKLSGAINNTDEESKKAALGFGRMGISLSELQGKSATEQLQLVSDGLQSIQDPGERAAAAIAVFGKSGAELLPLLTNFKGEMSEASATVGSMADIMNRRANVFDAVGDRFLVIQQKVRDFAAGILDRALPAIDAITSALSRIDAAAAGQRLANAFLGGQQAMKGFQAAVDAISIGKVGLAFEVFWASLKLQSMQTADAVYKNFVASFNTAADFLIKLFGPGSGAFSVVVDSFGVLGLLTFKAFAQAFQSLMPEFNRTLLSGLETAAKIAPGIFGPAALSVRAATSAVDIFSGSIDAIDAKITKQEGNLNKSFEGFKENATEAGKALPDSFENNYSKIPPLFADLSAQQAKVAELEGQVTAATAATTAEREKQGAQTSAELATRQAIRDAAAAQAAQEKADALALVELETQINLAKADGNDELAKSLEDEKKSLETKEQIKKLTEEYTQKLGLTQEKAHGLAVAFVNAQNAVNGINNKDVVVSVTTKVETKKYEELLASLAAGTKDPKIIKVVLDLTGEKDVTKAFETLEKMQNLNKNFEAVMKVSGSQSLEEFYQKLNGIPTFKEVQTALKITGAKDLDHAIDRLNTYGVPREAELKIKSMGFESVKEFVKALEGIPSERRLDLFAKTAGIEDINDLKYAVDRVLIDNGKKTTVTAEAKAETETAKAELEKLKTPATISLTAEPDFSSANNLLGQLTAPKTVQVDAFADTGKASASLYELGNIQPTINFDPAPGIQNIERQLDALPIINADLNADDSINKIQSDLKKEVDVSLQSSEGTKLLGDITGFVEGIKGLVETLSDKLPVPALA